jgi:hypothetical protein
MVSHNEQNSTNLWIGWVFNLTQPNPEYGQSQPTELPPTYGFVGHLAKPNLILELVCQNQQNSTNPWTGCAFCLAESNPEYGPSQSTELHRPMNWLGIYPHLI